MCRVWAKQGHDVHVITCTPNVPHGIPYPGYKNRFCHQEWIDGVRVTRVWTLLAANKGILRRGFSHLSYMLTAFFVSLFLRRPDIIIASSPQFFCGWAGLFASRMRIRRVPFILEIRDLWPDSISALGAMKDGLIMSCLYLLEKWLYRGADHLVTVGPGYREDLLHRKEVPENKLSIITNGVDREMFQPQARSQKIMERYGILNRFICGYVGTIGLASGLDCALEAARILKQRGRNDIRILLVGDGERRKELQEKTRSFDLDNIIYTGRLPRHEIPAILATLDIGLVHLKKCDQFKRVLPSKIFEIAAMEKPIVLGVEGYTKNLLEEANAGVCIEPENPIAMADAICCLADSPAMRHQMGASGRQYMLAHYDREVLALDYLDLMISQFFPEWNDQRPQRLPRESGEPEIRPLPTKESKAA